MSTETRDRHVCASCGKRFVVVYHQLDPDEPSRDVSIGCPYCGAVNRAPVASAAAAASHYHAERIGS